MMLQKQWKFVLIFCISILFMTGGCGNKRAHNIEQPSPIPDVHSASMLVAYQPMFTNIPIYKDNSGLVWVPLEESVKSMSLNLHKMTNASLAIGNTDPVYSVNMNQTQSLVGDNPIALPQAPKFIDHKPYITTQALSTLMGTKVVWNEKNSQVIITPIDDSSLAKKQSASSSQQPGPSSTEKMRSQSLSTAKKYEIISYARKFLGTPYHFAAGSYSDTHTFDCSSFVQHVYAHFNVELPRSSRSQSEVGQTVDANQLQPGDLMFFYTPGRYSSNRIVGHVGMYAGNGKIIQTYGDPGVTISDFNAYWKGRFLFAKRVV
ncbi:C40 family peptidase [Paenibacillus sp. sgz302251]|uniref:C40 family peptidase n=1 Tax=Paenibacillus sp. sgz302251 TaxID=3414493 RepID=UPI003C7C8138